MEIKLWHSHVCNSCTRATKAIDHKLYNMTSNASITLLFIKVAMAEAVAKRLLEKLQYPPSAAIRKRIKLFSRNGRLGL